MAEPPARERRMVTRRRLSLVAAAGGAVIAIVAVVSKATAQPPHFSGEYAFQGMWAFAMPTTISVTQAFHDVGIVAPAEIRDMRYEADPQAYAPFPNPLQAVFSFPCGQTAGFAKGSNLQYGSSGGGNWPSPDEDVFLFAQSQGWHATDPTARWYYNTQSYDGKPVALDWLEVLVTGRTICTAYVYTDLTAHFASPDGERHAAGVRSDKNCATAECSSTVSC